MSFTSDVLSQSSFWSSSIVHSADLNHLDRDRLDSLDSLDSLCLVELISILTVAVLSSLMSSKRSWTKLSLLYCVH